jgi:hypothetical protein
VTITETAPVIRRGYRPGRTGVVLSGDPGDPIDRLMFFTGGDILNIGDPGDGGEYDTLTGGLISTTDRRRLAGAQLVSATRGMRADQLLDIVCELCPTVRDLNPDEFVGWYYDECLAGLDYRAKVRAGECDYEPDPDDEPTQVAPTETRQTGTVPTWATEWRARLIHAPKIALLDALIAHRYGTGPAPKVPGDDWAVKLNDRFNRKASK